jgi:hypothetical protein
MAAGAVPIAADIAAKNQKRNLLIAFPIGHRIAAQVIGK